jgi:hypothetical protein
MTGSAKHVASDRDGWCELLSEFVGVGDAQKAATAEKWRGLLSEFVGVRNALQAAVGQPSAHRCTFNVFAVTHRSGFETTTHSALLCDLLDPRGSHGQGGAFLKAFLEIIDDNLPRDPVRPPWPPADGWWRVTAEARTEDGRLDIVLANRGPSGPATIVIENKWDARLGKRQLERYGEYLAKLTRSERSHRTCLVYLTRDRENYRELFLVDLLCLSHSVNISALIQSVLETSKDNVPPALREPLLQYCSILGEDDV